MKIRTGFVSNSSSSSFVIVGISMDRDEQVVVKDGLRKLLEMADDCTISEMIEPLSGKGKPLEGITFLYNEGSSPLLGIILSYGEDIKETPIHKITADGVRIADFLCKIGINKSPSLFSGVTYD